ncbi:MAG TPA: UDP-N-acetylglucosamine 1-carboxyvinyltransferase [Polyangia bacterium]
MIAREPSAETPGDRLIIKGGARLRGTVPVAGSVTGAQFLLAAALLGVGARDARGVLRNVPAVGAVRGMRARLASLGLSVEARGGVVAVTGGGLRPASDWVGRSDEPGALVRFGALLGRWGQASLTLPTPEAVAALASALRGLNALGAEIGVTGVTVRAEGGRLRGGSFTLAAPSATETATLMLAAALARGRTALENCALTPEIEELGRVLNKMGGRVHGAGTALVTIEGVEALEPVEHTLLPDRIEAGTLMLAAAITRGDLLVRNCVPEHLLAVTDQLRAARAEVTAEGGGLRVRGSAELAPIDIALRPHPGVPRALAAPFLVLMARARGESVMSDVPGLAVAEFARLGLDVQVVGDRAVVGGPRRLKGGRVTASDPGMAAALVLAGLAAEGTTEILRISHLDRGYERLDRKLKAVGAEVRRARATPSG